MPEAERKVWEHDWQIKTLGESIVRTDANIENLRRDVDSIKDEREKDRIALAEFISTAKAAAEAAKQAAEKSVTAKQLYLTGLGIAATIVAALIGIKG